MAEVPPNAPACAEAFRTFRTTSSKIELPPNFACVAAAPVGIGPNTVVQGRGETSVVHLIREGSLELKSGATIRGLLIMSSSTQPSVQSRSSSGVRVQDVAFANGGIHVSFSEVSQFRIENTRHRGLEHSNTFIYIYHSQDGDILHPMVQGELVLPIRPKGGTRAISIVASRGIQVKNPVVRGIDATVVSDYAGLAFGEHTTNSSVRGGVFEDLKNADAVVVESGSSDIRIDGVVGHNISSAPGVGEFGNVGDLLDIYNARHVRIANCYSHNIGQYLKSRHPGLEIFASEDVTARDSEFSDSGYHGIVVAGSPRTALINIKSNRNYYSGAAVSGIIGKCDTDGKAVLATSGSFGLLWSAGTVIEINKKNYRIESVLDAQHLRLASSAGRQSGVTFRVDSDVEITGGEYNGNGLGRAGRGLEEGIYFDNASVVRVTGVTATDTKPAKTQTYGMRINPESQVSVGENSLQGNKRGEIAGTPR